ncbi:MAG: mandelate racemase/muconate lactonizing enzyme family protein [Cyclobacteriaceae bacterium]|nr:mandelate racemase/muconate lactonizing enzyme family protein [Cyclobacteriaceae bacterium]
MSSKKMTRRKFVEKSATMAAGLSAVSSIAQADFLSSSKVSKVTISAVDSNFEREPLIKPYRFKGSGVSEIWQTVSYLKTDTGLTGIGLGTQSVLWSDSKVFFANSENGGNALMYAVTERAIQMMLGAKMDNPIDTLDQILPEVFDYAKKITRNPDLRKTYALNALVCLDNALWQLYFQQNKFKNFDDMIPHKFKQGVSHRHTKVASIPSFSVGTPIADIKAAADQGYFIMKLKTGASGTQKEMIEKDIEFLTQLHKAIGDYETPYTKNGKIPYYFDANGRYETKETLMKFLDQAEKIKAFDQISVLEEPFDEFNETYVGDLGVRVAADESAHTEVDAARRIEQGYGAIAVKAIAKTLSMTLKIAQLAYEKKIPCFCADLTVNPILVDWNKSIAARLQPFPEMDIGLQETNGHQNYKNWEEMMSYHPRASAEWTKTKDGIYAIGKEFYSQSAGILDQSDHYVEMFQRIRR